MAQIDGSDRRQKIEKLKAEIREEERQLDKLNKKTSNKEQRLARLKHELKENEDIDAAFKFRNEHADTYQQWQAKIDSAAAEDYKNTSAQSPKGSDQAFQEKDPGRGIKRSHDTCDRDDDEDAIKVYIKKECVDSTDEAQTLETMHHGHASIDQPLKKVAKIPIPQDHPLIPHLRTFANLYPGLLLDRKNLLKGIWEHHAGSKPPLLDMSNKSVKLVVDAARAYLNRTGSFANQGSTTNST